MNNEQFEMEQLKPFIELQSKEIAAAINEAPHLTSYIYKGVRERFKEPLCGKIIERVKELI